MFCCDANLVIYNLFILNLFLNQLVNQRNHLNRGRGLYCLLFSEKYLVCSLNNLAYSWLTTEHVELTLHKDLVGKPFYVEITNGKCKPRSQRQNVYNIFNTLKIYYEIYLMEVFRAWWKRQPDVAMKMSGIDVDRRERLFWGF